MNDDNRPPLIEAPDLATLSWCLGEIRESLAASEAKLREQLAGADAQGDDLSGLRAARASLHQAHGALAVVDVPGVSLLSGEAETLLDLVERGQVRLSRELVDRVLRSYTALVEYLDELLLGEPQQPLYLFPYYRDLLEARGAERVHPADLFVVPVAARLVVAGAQVRELDADALAAARARFERGLLQVLRNPGDEAGIAALHEAIDAVGASQVGARHPTFWKVALAFFEALRDRTIALDVYGKRLLARMNLQLRRSIFDGTPVAERLMKDALFALARADAVGESASPLLVEVRRAFRLEHTVPEDFETPRFGRVDARALSAARDAVARAKPAWEKLVLGSPADLAAFAKAVASLRAAVAILPGDGMRALAEAFTETSRVLAMQSGPVPESLAQEGASALLFAEQVFERKFRGHEGLDARAAEMAARLLQATRGAPVDEELPQWLRDLGHAAQERLTMASFIAEAQGSLRSAEQVLDSFFRAPSQRNDLPQTVRQLHQVAGALQVLGHRDAAAAAGGIAERVQGLAAQDTDPSPDECELVASSLGALGFFIDGLQQPGRSGTRFTFDAASGRFSAELNEPRRAPPSVVVALDARTARVPQQPSPDTAESLLVGHSQRAGELIGSLRQAPDDAALRSELRETLKQLRDDAQLVDDGALKSKASDAIALLDAGGVANDTSLEAALADIAGAQSVQASVEPEELPRDEAEIDSELLEIFLGEACEVLDAIGEAVAQSRNAPTDQAFLTTIRRGFHTLKGSSRMVGLAGFGDAGWAMEQVLNLWLAEERAGTPTLYTLIGLACKRFEGWVDRLQEGASFRLDPQPMIDAAHALREGQPHEAAFDALAAQPLEAAAASPQPASPREAEPALAPAPAPAEAAANAPLHEDAPAHAEAVEAIGFIEAADLAGAQPAGDDARALVDREPVEVVEPVEPVEVLDVFEDVETPADSDAVQSAGAIAEPPGEVPDEVRVGDRTISRPLYDIFLSEADDLIATLGADTAAWADQPGRAATEAAQRAMHSLKGSAALVELHGVQAIAEQLETFLLRQRASGRPMTDADLADYARTIERVQAMLHRFAAGSAPGEEPEALALAHALASRWDPRNEPQPEPEAVAVRAPMASELDEELLPIFIEEATDYLPKIGENLRRWQSSPADRSLQLLLMRHLHTIKGSARMAGAMDLGQLVHEMETRIEAASALSVVPAALIEELIADYDGAVAMFEAIRDSAARAGGHGPAATEAVAPTTPVAASPAAVVSAGIAPAAEPEPRAPARSAAAATEAARPRAAQPDAAPAPARPVHAQQAGPAIPGAAVAARAAAAAVAPSLAAASLVRVRSDLLERVVNESGEVSIARSRLDNELGQLRQSLQDLTENVGRLRSQLREIEIQAESQIQARIALQRETSADFDPLEFDRYTRFQELTRMLAESVNDVATVQQNAMRSLDDASQDMVRQSQVLRELQQNLMRMRMVQFGSISDRLYRVVRQAAKELGKRVALDIRGASVEVDRGVLERMANPVEHLLRNAVAHGIESPAQRQATGKPETGEIRVEVRQEGNEVVLAVSDDGAGLDYAKILARARNLGLVAEGAQPGERELADMIFTPGFSTATEVTELAGRGVGTDVVRAEVLSLGGRIDVDSTRGAATRFTVHLPLTLAIAQVVLVSVGAAQYAIPSSSVEQVLQLKPQALAAAYGDGSIDWQGARVPMHYLGALVGVGDARPIAQHLSPVVIVRSANLRLAIHVDAVSRNQEVVVKNVGAQVARVPGVSGATVLGNGEIVLILNPARLAQAVLGDLWLERPAPGTRSAPLAEVPPAVMVVDDSLTVRKATQRLLAREGYDVMLAKDGVDALRQLQDRQPDVMLVDIEMPRMDGFDLTRHVRGDERLRELPIVMITSRTADKHRNYAMSLGVNAYLGKPYRDDELLGQVAMFTSSRRRRAGA
ncbi:MAG: Hpt domain-containing protein [Burkholderiaceae bacterium]